IGGARRRGIDLRRRRALDRLGVAGAVGREVLDPLAVGQRRLGGRVVDGRRGGRVGRIDAGRVIGPVEARAAGVGRIQRRSDRVVLVVGGDVARGGGRRHVDLLQTP